MEKEALYVRSYLFQRAKLLKIYRKKIRKQKNLPRKIYKEFALPIAIARQKGDDQMAQTELWRIMGISIRSSDENTDDVDSSDITVDSNLAVCPNYGLSLKCRWISDAFGSTVGVNRVRRVIRDLSTLNRWREYRGNKKQPITDLEKCIKLYNTVDLDVKHPWHVSRVCPLSGFNITMLEKKFITPCAKTSKPITSQYCSESCKLFVCNCPRIENLKSTDFVEITSNQVSLNEMSDNGLDDLHEKLESKVIDLNYKKLKSSI